MFQDELEIIRQANVDVGFHKTNEKHDQTTAFTDGTLPVFLKLLRSIENKSSIIMYDIIKI